MTSSLVGSEMCIRDRHWVDAIRAELSSFDDLDVFDQVMPEDITAMKRSCLLYTSDAADDM
eukprot:4990801-Prorocentrum_lima.AAC.1